MTEPSLPPPPLTIAPEQRPDLAERRFSVLALWLAIRKSWALVTIIALAVSVGVAFVTLGQQKIFEAQATVLFDPQPPRPLGNQVQAVVDVGGEYWNNKEYYKTQFWVIQSQRLAIEVVKELGLDKDPSFIPNLPTGNGGGRAGSVEDAGRALRARLTVEAIRDSRLAVVRFRDADPKRAQRVVATLVDTYADNNLDDALNAMSMAADWLGNQVDSLKTQLETSEMALHDYKMDKNILSVSMDDQSNMLRGEMQQLNGALTTIKTRREEISARRAELQKITPEDPANVPATELLASPLLNELRGRYIDALSARNVLLASGKGASHPDVLSVDAKLQSARTALMAEVANVRGAVDLEYGVVTNEFKGVQGLFENAKQRALQLNLLEIEFNRLKRTKDNNAKLYDVVTERSKENDLTRMLRINNIRVMDRPQVPRSPVSPNVPLNLASGIVAGLVLGLVAALGREQLDRSIKTPDDAERELGLTFLGLLPSMADGTEQAEYGRRRRTPKHARGITGSHELIVHNHPTSGVAEAARAIRTNILFMSPDRPFRTLLVTSAAPAEGKTTVACAIAIAMAQAGRKVVLLDCDMRRPRIHRVFNKPNDIGITTALLDLKDLSQIIRDTDIPNLSVITTGPIPPNPAEILHSEAFERFLKMVSSQFDSVVIDSPPVAPVTDAAVLSARVDGTILVVRAFRTSKELARRAVRALRDVSGRTVGTVLNAVDLQRRDYGYNQYYYYRREGYSADSAPPSDQPSEEQTPAS